MTIGEICTRNVVIAHREDSVVKAAQLMRTLHVGDVVVVEAKSGINLPIGIFTDRDLVMEVIAMELDPEVITVGDVMSAELASVKESCGIFESIQYMRSKGVRRMVVTNDHTDGLVGIVTLDDLLALIGDELAGLGQLFEQERSKELASRRS